MEDTKSSTERSALATATNAFIKLIQKGVETEHNSDVQNPEILVYNWKCATEIRENAKQLVREWKRYDPEHSLIYWAEFGKELANIELPMESDK